jgi:ADP-ribosyl-[dinitrogen reductase] hydrolase
VLGLAVTDSLGAPVEFRARHSFAPVTRLLPNPNFGGLPAGCFTDDTSMALCLAASLVDCRGRGGDPVVDQVQRYVRWWQDGYMSSTGACFDIGVSTQGTLATWVRVVEEGGGGWGAEGSRRREEVGGRGLHEVEERFGGERFCGNGSLMRVLPVGLVYWKQGVARAVEMAVQSSRATHPHPRCGEACAVYTRAVVAVLQGKGKEGLVQEVNAAVEDEVLRGRLARYRTLGDWVRMAEESILSTGYVVDSLEAALWAFFSTGSFEEGALRVVNLGDDADTVGAIYGGLAGAYYGVEAIPEEWVMGLRRREVVEEVINGLLKLQEIEERTI